MTISNALKRIYATAPDDAYYIETLQLSHPGFPGGVRYITNERDGWQGRDEQSVMQTFEFVPFSAIPPRSEEENNSTLQVAIDNASRALADNLEAIAGLPTAPVLLTYRIYIDPDQDTIHYTLNLDILAVVETQQLVTFSASLDNLRAKPFPAFLYLTSMYPGLAR